jgi:hypothetical protein
MQQHHATVLHCTADRSQAGCYSAALWDWPLTGVVGRSYDMTGRGYAIDRSPRVKTNRIGGTVRCPNYHQDTLAFNTLATV